MVAGLPSVREVPCAEQVRPLTQRTGDEGMSLIEQGVDTFCPARIRASSMLGIPAKRYLRLGHFHGLVSRCTQSLPAAGVTAMTLRFCSTAFRWLAWASAQMQVRRRCRPQSPSHGRERVSRQFAREERSEVPRRKLIRGMSGRRASGRAREEIVLTFRTCARSSLAANEKEYG